MSDVALSPLSARLSRLGAEPERGAFGVPWRMHDELAAAREEAAERERRASAQEAQAREEAANAKVTALLEQLRHAERVRPRWRSNKTAVRHSRTLMCS